MYSKKVINENLDKFEVALGWHPEPHTYEEIESFKKYIDSLIKIESNSKHRYVELVADLPKSKAKEIRRWIENEQAMCALDCSYWEDNYVYIHDPSNEIIKFSNMRSQEVFDGILAEREEKNMSIELLVMSSRQTGISTKAILKLTHRALFYPHTEALIGCPQYNHSSLLEKVAQSAYNNCPWWLLPVKKGKREFENGSRLSFQCGSRLSEGLTPQCTYVTNISDYSHPLQTFEEGLFRSIFTTVKTLTILHGSIGSKSSWSGSFWEYSKQNFDKGRSRFMPVYIPWPVCSDWYPGESFIKFNPVPEKWVPSQATKDHKIRCEGYINKTPYLSKVMGATWKMPLEQQWYYEYNYNHAVAAQNLDRWVANMAADDDECISLTEEMNREVDLDDLFPSASIMQDKMATIA